MNISKLVHKCAFALVTLAVTHCATAMDNKLFIGLHEAIDSGDLARVHKHVKDHGLVGHLNDTYSIAYTNDDDASPIWEYQGKIFHERCDALGRVPVTQTQTPMDYVLGKYRDAHSTFHYVIAQQSIEILRYFLEECNATFKGVAHDQGRLVRAVLQGDVAAVRLFTRFGMLQLPRFNYNGDPINVIEMVRAEHDIDGNTVSDECKAQYREILPLLEVRPAPESTKTIFTPRNMIIAAVAAVIGGLLIKKACDWYFAKPEDDEQEQPENTTAPVEQNQVNQA
jgi:hypothetical protein